MRRAAAALMSWSVAAAAAAQTAPPEYDPLAEETNQLLRALIEKPVVVDGQALGGLRRVSGLDEDEAFDLVDEACRQLGFSGAAGPPIVTRGIINDGAPFISSFSCVIAAPF